jgi:hypothetical protein
MIKLVAITPVDARNLDLGFSDGSHARWNADDIIARDTVLTRPLTDPAYFARAFVEAGALAWPNGLEFSGDTLHRRFQADGTLIKAAA